MSDVEHAGCADAAAFSPRHAMPKLRITLCLRAAAIFAMPPYAMLYGICLYRCHFREMPPAYGAAIFAYAARQRFTFLRFD